MTTSPYLNAREMVDYLRLGSVDALYRLVNQHRLPYYRRGKQYLFDRREVDAWVRSEPTVLEVARPHARAR